MRLIHGDCLVEMDKLIQEGVKVDAIITSPPYNKAGYEGFIRKRHKDDNWKRRNIDYDDESSNDFMEESKYQEWQIEVLNKCWELLKDDGSIFYNHKVRVAQHKASHPIEWLLKTKLNFRQQIIWDRKSSPAISPIRYIPSTELVFWLTKTATQPRFERKDDTLHKGEVWTIQPSKNENHPATFPSELVENIVYNLPEDSLILDCFMGIGTTGVVCKKLNRDFIGIELVKDYFDYSKKRIENIENNSSTLEKFI